MHLEPKFLVVLTALLASCAGSRFDQGIYRDMEVAYRVGPLGPGWNRVHLSGANLTFIHEGGGAILVNASCHGIKDLPLDVLTNQALFEVEGQREKSRDVMTLDGRAALRTRLSGSVDGVTVELDLVVMKKGRCTYDIQLVAGGDTFAAREQDFYNFVAGFHELEAKI
jgi:hypothetical protein